MRLSATFLVAAIASGVSIEQCQGFSVSSNSVRRPAAVSSSSSAVSMVRKEEESAMKNPSRREMFTTMASALVAMNAAVLTAAPQEASAKYSDYARREKDWEERLSKGEVKISSARDLRAQLQEIAPMNTSSSKIFCPNGPSANVSPLMENKCGDRLAAPSVYGRTNDVMGNSIPGFKDGYAWMPGESSSVSAAVGGFPTYKENEWKIREYGN